MPRLSDSQRAVVEDQEHHLLVEAGAGSGKTTTLVAKLMYEIGMGHTPPRRKLELEQLVAVTFTRKAAAEIRDRLRSAILHRADKAEGVERERLAQRAFAVDTVDIGTIDSLAHRIVRDYGPLAGTESGYDLLDEVDAAALQEEVAATSLRDQIEQDDEGAGFLVKHFGFINSRTFLTKALQDPALVRQSAGVHAGGDYGVRLSRRDRLLEPVRAEVMRTVTTAWQSYTHRLRQEGVLDFAHMVAAARSVVRNDVARRALSQRIGLLLVDEHQDTSPTQAQLLFALAGLPRPGRVAEGDAARPPGEDEARLILIGDPKQSIYRFRGADVRVWAKSARTLESVDGRRVALADGFRSGPELTDFFHAVPGVVLSDATLRPFDVSYTPLNVTREWGPPDPPIEILVAHDQGGTGAVAWQVASRIRQMLDDSEAYPVWDKKVRTDRPVEHRDIAILMPELKRSGPVYAHALHSLGIPFRMEGGSGLYQRPEIVDLTILLSAIADPYDPLQLASYLRSPFAGVDDETIDHLMERVREEQDLSLFEAVLSAQKWMADPPDALLEGSDRLRRYRAIRDRVGHDVLVRRAITDVGYDAFLAGAPDQPIGLRNIDKFLHLAAERSAEPLFLFVQRLEDRINRADREREAPLYTVDDRLVTVSTIHKAKGLEWPVVFVSELGSKVTRRPWVSHGPRLHPKLGVILPVDILLEDQGTRGQVKEPSNLWERYEHSEIDAEYAEAKRKFYVACTRARDRLFLAGTLNEFSGGGLVSSYVYSRLKDTYDRWLQVRIPELLSMASGGGGLTGTGGHRIVVRTEVKNHDGVALAKWPEQRELQNRKTSESKRRAIETASGPTPQGPVRTEFSVSEFLQYQLCPWKHFFGYRMGISVPRIEATPDIALVKRILPEKRGDIIHHYLGEHDDDWSSEEVREQVLRTMLWHIPMSEEQAGENVEELERHIWNYLNSDVHGRVKRADRVLREIPFVYRLREDVRIRGVIDLLFHGPAGWEAVDYKTGYFSEKDEEAIEIAVQDRVKRYDIQGAIYSLAVSGSSIAAGGLQAFHFFFTPPGICHTISIETEWLDKMRTLAGTMVDQIRAGDYGPHPTYAPGICENCEYLTLCKPSEMPEHEPTRAHAR